jgi:4-amino-4-deoxy-L-arabinose transferase-like glycosyltransferase
MALSPLFWLQSGLALTDMLAMLFVVAFLLVEDIRRARRKAIA